MENRSNIFAGIVDWLGVVFERLNPSLFRFLAAFLPYLSPVPVSVVTAKSAGEFLDFETPIAFVLVFVLGGIGLWFTSLLVDAVVDYVRGGKFRDLKSLSVVFMFVASILMYIGIEVGLNVAIHTEDTTPARQIVIFLLSMLPLITGVGNGYYKLKLQHRTDTEISIKKQEDLAEKIRQEKRQDKIIRYKIRHGIPLDPPANPTSQFQSTVTFKGEPASLERSNDTERKEKPASFYKEKMWVFMDAERSNGRIPTVVQIAKRFNLDYERSKGFISGQRKLWAQSRGVDLKSSDFRGN